MSVHGRALRPCTFEERESSACRSRSPIRPRCILLLLIGVLVLEPLLALSSEGWRARVTPPDLVARLHTWRARIIAVGSLIVGAATHLAWDAVTHTDGAAVRHWPMLRLSVVGPHRLYNVIGYASSLGGLLLLGIVVLRWYRRAPHGNGEHWRAPPRGMRRWVLGGIAVAAAAGAGIALADPVSQVSAYDWVRRLFGRRRSRHRAGARALRALLAPRPSVRHTA
ncbi:DUF4184 family protein [Saccharothrix deserti]|uniref:DUF4184 family protein n=1 Tax=Saccharothrix deserti TaxID=2593674 RepID=UPI00236896BE|nr:DUF4184 family protein [Saccharothrix deserti]